MRKLPQYYILFLMSFIVLINLGLFQLCEHRRTWYSDHILKVNKSAVKQHVVLSHI